MRLLTLATGLLLAAPLAAQPSSLTTFGGADDDAALAVTVDASGHVYVAGTFEGTVDFDPSDAPDADDTFTALGFNTDGFVASYTASGDFRWVVPFGGSGAEAVNGVATDGDRVFVAGQFSTAEVDADPGPGTAILVRAGETDGFVAAYSASGGAFAWAFPLGGADLDVLRSVAVDNGQVLIGGLIENIVDLDPSDGTAFVGTSFRYGMLLASYAASDGSYQWGIAPAATTTLSFPLGLAIDDTRVYTAGQFAGTTDFDAGDGTFALTSNPGGPQQDGYIAAYERADGAFAWAGAISGNNLEKATSIATDGERVYVGGFFSRTVDFDPGAGVDERTVASGDVFDPFVAAYTASGGAFEWVNAISSTATDSGSEETAAVAVIGSRVYAVGRISGTADFEDGPGVSEASAIGFDDAFFASYNVETGAFADVNMIGGPSNERSLGVTVTPDDVVVVGAFATRAPGQTVDFDPGPGEMPVTSNGDLDAFIATYPLPDGVPTEPLAPEAAARLAVWPNPSVGGATVRLEAAASGPAEVALMDALGRRVATLFSGPALAGQPVEVAVPLGLAPGTYLVRAVTPGGVQSEPLTVVR